MNSMAQRICRPLLLALGLGAALPSLAQDAHRLPPEKLSSAWVLLNTKVDADVPNSGKNMDKPGCVAVSYLIGSDGLTRNVQVRKVVPQSDLGPVAASIVARFKYGPMLSNTHEDAVSTYYIVPFNAPDDPKQRDQLMQACRLPGYDQG